MKSGLFLTCLLLAVPPLASAQVQPLVGTYLGDGQRNYYGNVAPSRLRVHWKTHLGSATTRVGRAIKKWSGTGWTGQPLVIREGAETYLIIGSLSHHIKKIRARDGKVIWSTDVGDAIKGTPTFADVGGSNAENRYVLITGSRMGRNCNFLTDPAYGLHGVSYMTGKHLWRHNLVRTESNSRDVDASAVMIGSKACVPLENGFFTVFSPSPSKTSMVNGFPAPKIYKQLKLYTPNDLARYGSELSCESSPTVYGGKAYVAAGCGRVYACSTGWGGIGWTLDTGGDLNGTMPLTNDSHLLLGIEREFISGQGGVMKIKPGKGPVWYFPQPNVRFYEWGGGMVGSPAVNHRYNSGISKDLACFVGVDGRLTLVNHKQVQPGVMVAGPRGQNRYPTPVVLDQVKLPKGSISTPLFVGNRIIIGYDNGMDLYQVTAAGKLQRLDRLSGPMFDATPVVWNGRVYAGSKNGYLYCLGN
ncbi:hypothetical protein NT6N_14210 [Oceaniferula spumae]|uniref:Pyrrolo-quinoline quinone n=1 Tax=Oceaniferula spumae TaxID=2979115 RepID=A0AAT9FJY6_9BACT